VPARCRHAPTIGAEYSRLWVGGSQRQVEPASSQLHLSIPNPSFSELSLGAGLSLELDAVEVGEEVDAV